MMRLVTWNTHHGGQNGKLVPQIGDALAALMPDIVTLQEVEQYNGYGNMNQVDVYRRRLGMADGVGALINGKLATPGASGKCNALLSRWPVSDVQIKALGGTPESRVALCVVIGGVTILTTHLDHVSADTRAKQIGKLAVWAPLSRSWFIAAGDWNAVPGAPEIAPLLTRYEDAWMTAVRRKTATAFNESGATKNTRIDAVFTRGLTVVRASVPDTRINGGTFVSDHHPLVIDFEWPPAGVVTT